jgi:hypothetical protein
LGGTFGPPTVSELPDFSGTPGAAAAAGVLVGARFPVLSGTPGAAAAALLGGAGGVMDVALPCPTAVDGVRRMGPASALLVIKIPNAITKTDNELVDTSRLEQEAAKR